MKYHVGSQSFLHVRAVQVNKFFRVQLQTSHVSVRQGTNEKHRELYMKYSERASQYVTQYSTTSRSGIAGFASIQGMAMRSLV